MSEAQTKNCQSCQADFTIEPDDFAFYAKIDVPPPTWCPDCRAQRRLAWRNERTLYRRQCVATGKGVLSMFAPATPFVVYDREYWWSDQWDQLASGQAYDFGKPFFEQYRELLARAPLPNLFNTNVENSEYGNHNANCKDCYLVFASFKGENLAYASGCVDTRDSQDLYVTEYCENCYDSTLCGTVYGSNFCFDVDDTTDSSFIRLCKNLDHCLGCINLGHKQHHIFNQPYTKEAYERALAEYDFGSYRALTAFRQRYEAFIAPYPRRYATILNSEHCTGDQIIRSKNVRHSFDVYGETEDSKYVSHTLELKDGYDGYGVGGGADLIYEAVDTGIGGTRYAFTVYAHHGHDLTYAYACQNSSYLFGCVGLRSKQYCILNQQYTKEEYEALVPQIIQQMNALPYVDRLGREYRYGEFFPPDLSPFAYNETIAQEYFRLSRQEATSQGFRWRNPEPSRHAITIKATDLPDRITETDESILQEVIGCEHEQQCDDHCTQAFRIQPKELAFLIQKNLPLPRLCPNCRHFERVAQRNPLRLYTGTCHCAGTQSQQGTYTNQTEHAHGSAPCDVTFQTPYAPARPETVYCDVCYQAEVV